ncbi:peptidoglycan recognition protein family protein [Streptomyces noursei]
MERRELLLLAGAGAAGLILPSAIPAFASTRPIATRAAWFDAVLEAEDVATVPVGDWSRHNRDHKGPFGPMTGVMIHHTASRGERVSVNICRDGRPDLPGPLCHGVIAKSGAVYLVGYGRANHAGLGDSRVLRALRKGRKLPKPVRWDTDGNRYFYGFECINAGDGRDPWPKAQVEAIVRVATALCMYHGWDASRVIGHKEWQRGKIDPKGISMKQLRAEIDHRLAST